MHKDITTRRTRWPLQPALLLALLPVTGCTQEMYDQPKYEVYEASPFFPDGSSARPPVEGTVARGEPWRDHPFFTGRVDGRLVADIPSDPRRSEPFRRTRQVLERGRNRFNIFCSHCHGRTGYGNGMVVQRGFHRPPSLHEARLRDAKPGHFFDVMTNGFRNMPQQGTRIDIADRWAIAAYIGALQTSQYLPLNEAPSDIRERFNGARGKGRPVEQSTHPQEARQAEEPQDRNPS